MLTVVMHMGADQHDLDKEEMMRSAFTTLVNFFLDTAGFFISQYQVQPKSGAGQSLGHSEAVSAVEYSERKGELFLNLQLPNVPLHLSASS